MPVSQQMPHRQPQLRARQGRLARLRPRILLTPGPKPVEYRFTVKGENLYAIAQTWPGETAIVTSLAKGKVLDGEVPKGKIKSVTMLGHSGKLKFTQDADGLKVTLPTDKPCDYAWTLKIVGLKMNPAGPPVPSSMADLR